MTAHPINGRIILKMPLFWEEGAREGVAVGVGVGVVGGWVEEKVMSAVKISIVGVSMVIEFGTRG